MDLSIFNGYPQVEKVWGREIWLQNNPQYCGKLLVVSPGMMCSLHRHLLKTETFVVLEGPCWVQIGTATPWVLKHPGDSVHLPATTWHRFASSDEDSCVILELSSHHEDSDVERLVESGPIYAF